MKSVVHYQQIKSLDIWNTSEVVNSANLIVNHPNIFSKIRWPFTKSIDKLIEVSKRGHIDDLFSDISY